ncbi:ArsR/SmtB family transcription factor [Leifsonia sp. 2MCAF36]|uniref:ArsR/SmtB family transcription factor n=1 Tax=Leifsonia sp. 2MCAF36 TaxID=3232988 RepID=UPI003F98B00D
MPSLFSRGIAAPSEPGKPLLIYAARGHAAVWDSARGRRAEGLDQLLGSRRSEVLQMLEKPASSTELARRLGLSVPTVNQHLKTLQHGRLLHTSRRGRYTVYERTQLGDALARDSAD